MLKRVTIILKKCSREIRQGVDKIELSLKVVDLRIHENTLSGSTN
jgi:hypothetical protein